MPVAETLGISRHQLIDFYCELPTSQTPKPISGNFSAEANLALSICEQLRLLADGTYVALPTNLQRLLQFAMRDARAEVLMLATTLTAIQVKMDGG